MLAGPSLGRKIVEDIARLSGSPFDTAIDFVNGVGLVRIPGAAVAADAGVSAGPAAT
jgi:hypothetical protein